MQVTQMKKLALSILVTGRVSVLAIGATLLASCTITDAAAADNQRTQRYAAADTIVDRHTRVLVKYWPKSGRLAENWTEAWLAGQDGKCSWMRHGVTTQWYESGPVSSVACYQRGVLHGEYSEYWNNELLRVSGRYEDGQPIGSWRRFDEFGLLSATCNYVSSLDERKRSIEHLMYAEYYRSGRMQQSGEMVNHVCVGEWYWWHENGRLNKSGTFSDEGKRDGLWREWDAEGNLLNQEEFKNGIKVN